MNRKIILACMGTVVSAALILIQPATAEPTCNTGPFAPEVKDPRNPTQPLFPEQTGTDEGGTVSGTIHDNGEVLDHRLPYDHRPVHYFNCYVRARTSLW